MAGVLRFSDYLGGPDNIQVEEIFPSTQRTYQYNFGQNITGWTWQIDHQTLVVDPITWDRYTGEPNFANSRIIGSFPKVDLTIDSSVLNVVNAATGLVNITIPGGLYTGPVIPDARSKVPVTIVSITWTTAETPAQTNSHRWAFIQCYEPDVTIGDPTTSVSPLYTALTVA
jgi:hypothetical protein